MHPCGTPASSLQPARKKWCAVRITVQFITISATMLTSAIFEDEYMKMIFLCGSTERATMRQSPLQMSYQSSESIRASRYLEMRKTNREKW